MTSRKLRAPIVRRVLGSLALLVFTACGGIAIYEDGSGGTGGAGTTVGTGSGSTRCVSGTCGDTCVRCEGADCKAGRCDASLTCVAGSTIPKCN